MAEDKGKVLNKQEMTRWLSRHPRNSRQILGVKKIGRNDPCLCGSGKKFKKCCWSKFQSG